VEALIQSNAVARYFLGTSPSSMTRAERSNRFSVALGNASAAQALLRTLPNGISEIIDDDDTGYHATEHQGFVQLYGVFACYELVEEVLARSPKTTYVTLCFFEIDIDGRFSASKVEQLNWRKNLSVSYKFLVKAPDLANRDTERYREDASKHNRNPHIRLDEVSHLLST
jgi:hypothetical protein